MKAEAKLYVIVLSAGNHHSRKEDIMNPRTSKTPKHSPDYVQVTFREVDAYRVRFAAWLESLAGKQAKAAYYGLQLLELVSRYDVTLQGEREVERARRSLAKLLDYTYKPEG
jgi:hypothetical protein